MTHEELLSKVNEGRNARMALNILEPIFQNFEKELLHSLKAQFNAGKQTEMLMACHTAQLVAIDKLRDKLTGMERTGETSQTQIEREEYERT